MGCLFPIHCLGCGQEGVWLCESCFDRIDKSGVACCPVCHHFSASGLCCVDCRRSSSLKSVIAVTPYNEAWLIGELIRTVKYRYALDAADLFYDMVRYWGAQEGRLFSDIDVIVPVPLHPRRFAERGFNQAEIVAGAIHTVSSIPILSTLVRTRNTKRQARLSRRGRIRNVRDAFVVPRKEAIQNQRVLLVDDVYTTGSTMSECAKALLSAGAVSVSGFALARG